MTAPADLTPAHPDAVIFDVMTTWRTRTGNQPLTASRTNPDTGQRQAWSRKACAWLSVAEYAAEWRHGFRYRAVMGDEETTNAVTAYEKGLGL